MDPESRVRAFATASALMVRQVVLRSCLECSLPSQTLLAGRPGAQRRRGRPPKRGGGLAYPRRTDGCVTYPDCPHGWRRPPQPPPPRRLPPPVAGKAYHESRDQLNTQRIYYTWRKLKIS